MSKIAIALRALNRDILEFEREYPDAFSKIVTMLKLNQREQELLTQAYDNQ